MEKVCASVWLGVALVAMLVANWFEISSALSELVGGTVAELVIGVILAGFVGPFLGAYGGCPLPLALGWPCQSAGGRRSIDDLCLRTGSEVLSVPAVRNCRPARVSLVRAHFERERSEATC